MFEHLPGIEAVSARKQVRNKTSFAIFTTGNSAFIRRFKDFQPKPLLTTPEVCNGFFH